MHRAGGRSHRPSGAVLVLVPIGVAFVAVGVAYVPGWSVPAWDVAWTTAAIAALAGTLLARTSADPVSRSRWTLWALASACWLVGQMAWNVYGVIGFPSSPSLADAGWWAFAVLVIVSLLRVPGPRGVRLVALVEAVPLFGAASALGVAELWPAVTASSLALGSKISALVYPIVYSSAAVLMLQTMVGGMLRVQRTLALRLVLGGMAAQALAFILWSDQLLRGTYVPGRTLLDPLWVVGLAAIGAGGLIAASRPEPTPAAEEPGLRGGVLPTGMFLLLAAAIIQSRLGHSSKTEQVALEAGLICSSGALLIRSHLLAKRMRVTLERERAARADLAQREAQLAQLNQQLVEDSRRDPLTGLKNRRALADELPMVDAIHGDERDRIAVALCDIDHFKAYNDLLGHLAGDQALRMIAAIARAELRMGDSAYRFGGEELLLVMRGVRTGDAFTIAERVRLAVKRAAIPHPRGEGGILTVSIGVAAGSGEAGKLLGQADGALYEAKRSGRNRVLVGHAGASMPGLARKHRRAPEEPMPHHLRSMLAVSRAAASGEGPMSVLKTMAVAIRTELSFQVVAVNVFDEDRERLRVVIVEGDKEARETLLHTSSPWSEWKTLLAEGEDVHGAAWLKAGSYRWDSEAVVWTPPAVASLSRDSWHPEDMLLLPLRGADGEVLGVVSVDQPLSGCRPTHEQIAVLMAVADHAGMAFEHAQRESEAVRQESQELRLAAVLLLAETLDMRDPCTAKHARTVGQLARQTAAELGFEPTRVERVRSAGVLHDVGKLGIADAILHKSGALDETEWRETRRHPVVGARILEHAGLHDLALWVGQHHERFDGSGYPQGLRGEQIAVEARILAVADAYEAMTADRPYRAGMSAIEAREELVRCSGSQFDPLVVEAFLRSLERGAELAPEALESVG
jgi:diguanylate cyclase (GGDEF)-like protein